MASENWSLPPETEQNTAHQVRLELSVLPVINYALQQNRLPFVRAAVIVNDGGQPLQDVTLRLEAVPEICLPFALHIDTVPARCVWEVKGVAPVLNAELLCGLTEKVTGRLHAALECGGTTVYRQDIELTALAFDQWHGYGRLPELLAAFVTPNFPQIAGLNRRASEHLGEWTGDPSLDAYQRKDPNRVLAQAGAVYAAIQEQNIVYSVAPASFEESGQRIRLCDAVLRQKMGNCMDITLLYAACLEAAGLFPILILVPGHIFCGVWLEDQTFTEAVLDDVSLLTKRLADGVNELAVVECTLMNAGKNASFDAARARAAEELAAGIDLMVDVRRARLSGIAPLPLRYQTEHGWQVEAARPQQAYVTAAPQVSAAPIALRQTDPDAQFPKKVQWERKLLDLGLRNTLINMRLSRTVLSILTPSPDELEDALSDGGEFAILPRPADWPAPEGGFTLENLHELGGHGEMLRAEFKNRRLRSASSAVELEQTVKDLYRAAKVALEESGANTLYLSLGLLKWYETDQSTRPRFAPVILLPVELVRKSAAQGYVIRLRDEDPQINITMLEKIFQDYGIAVPGLDPIPQDEHGADIRMIFTILRRAVMGQARWDVLESACLGLFSFSQFVMWNDIRNRSEDLEKNKIVRSLMDGRLCWDARDMVPGDKVPEEDVLLPLPADASQLFAIRAACAGESFVLHGPPGTGKSQTITALIANALAQGKTVLFVAEKMAALSVVQNRLEDIGIGPFCLELHSNKSRKKDVLEQLRRACEVGRDTAAQDYAAAAQRAAALRHELDDYAEALHTPQPCGMTLYELVNAWEANRDEAALPALPADFAAKASRDSLARQSALVEQLAAAAQEVGVLSAHPLQRVGCTQYSQQLRSALPQTLSAYREALIRLKSAYQCIAPAIGWNKNSAYPELEQLTALVWELNVWLNLPPHWAGIQDLDRFVNDVRQMACHAQSAAALYGQLSQRWAEDFLRQDGNALLAEYREISAAWAMSRALRMPAMVRRVGAYARGPVSEADLEPALLTLCEYQKETAAVQQYAGLDEWVRYAGGNWQRVLEDAQAALESEGRLRQLPGGVQMRLNIGGRQQLSPAIDQWMTAWVSLYQPRAAACSLLGLTEASAAGGWMEDQIALCDTIAGHADGLRSWTAWQGSAAGLRAEGLSVLVEACYRGMPPESLPGAFRRAAYQCLADYAIGRSPALNLFSGEVFNRRIEQFRKADQQLMELTRREIFCRLASRVPGMAKAAAQSSEVGILQKAIRSGGRGVSIRRLFDQLPELLPRLCPCMLMSPLSAAQYLDPRRAPFDLVVFDEASQLPTCKAVGALARGVNAVVVGDPKQMPPTSFFAANAVDEEHLETEDLESILDDCLALNMPQTHLLWHYRSRHESLIAFSNSRFYENQLYTFPSDGDRDSRVRLVHVEGVFERGKNRCNRAEAEAVVAELSRRCHDPALAKRSVGVVTFNINQQNLIDDLLGAACRADPALEAWAYNEKEPVFIKNLENVQGDERDVILFSIGFGPDENGKFYMNFGPLNRDGGWRRLNVAVSRSRWEMVVFSTLRPEQIDLSRSSAEGVAALKAFLEYADSGRLPQSGEAAKAQRGDETGVAQSICAALAACGYHTDRRVGHSAFRVDIGVVDPDRPRRYRLGILLDGASYQQARTTRDRELSQTGILAGLGWRLLRVWSMDWWDNRDRELERILAALREPAEQEPEEEYPVPAAEPPALPGVFPAAEQPPQAMPEEPAPAAEDTPVEENAPALQQPAGAGMPADGAQNAVREEPYRAAVLPAYSVTAEELMQPRYAGPLLSALRQVLTQEAPISEELLFRRALQSFGISRAGSRVQTHLVRVCAGLGPRYTTQNGRRFYWRPDQDPAAYTGCRPAGEGADKREAKDIPLQEAVNAVVLTLAEQVSLPEEDLIRESAKRMGYPRMGGNAGSLFAQAVRNAVVLGKIRQGNEGRLMLND